MMTNMRTVINLKLRDATRNTNHIKQQRLIELLRQGYGVGVCVLHMRDLCLKRASLDNQEIFHLYKVKDLRDTNACRSKVKSDSQTV